MEFGRVLGSILEGFGAIWAIFWPLLGAFWSLLECSKLSFFQAWAQDGVQKAFWIDFVSILGGFGEGLGRDLGGFGGF